MDFLFVFICLVFILIGIFKSHNKTRSAAFVIMMLSLFNAIALSYARMGEGARISLGISLASLVVYVLSKNRN